MNQNIKAHIANSVSTLLFGLGYWIAKGLMASEGELEVAAFFNPMQIMFFRTGGAVMVFFLIASFFQNQRIERKDHRKIALAAFFGISVNQLLYFVGLNLSTPVETSIIHASSPILVVFFAALILKEGFSARKILGLVFGLAGSLLLILWGKTISLGSNGFLGNIFIFINITAYGLYLVLIKPIMSKYKPLAVIRFVFFYGFLFLLPFMIGDIQQIDYSAIPAFRWTSLLYIVFGTTVLTYILTIYALSHLTASVVGYYIYLQPVIAALVGVLLGKADITLSKIIATMLIFYGVYLVSIDRQRFINSRTRIVQWIRPYTRQ